ncbi:MAG: riboflavin biosynthesis protein RibD, partial [Hyphomicrobiaceae bacterium]|nr:riboflavin biosynthesis protein RibD [Hyphomicrobiaceae bacterium]
MAPSTRSGFDAHMMAIALRLAERGLGQTAPNPSVGSVIADETTGTIIARGWTASGGRPHAEVEALKRVCCQA